MVRAVPTTGTKQGIVGSDKLSLRVIDLYYKHALCQERFSYKIRLTLEPVQLPNAC